jgi:hypothetical protein
MAPTLQAAPVMPGLAPGDHTSTRTTASHGALDCRIRPEAVRSSTAATRPDSSAAAPHGRIRRIETLTEG